MTANARMLFTHMDTLEGESIEKDLLKYYELDTLAMVMIYEHWKWLTENN